MGTAVHMSNQILANLRRLLLQRNLEMLPNTLDSLEAALKKVTIPKYLKSLISNKVSILVHIAIRHGIGDYIHFRRILRTFSKPSDIISKLNMILKDCNAGPLLGFEFGPHTNVLSRISLQIIFVVLDYRFPSQKQSKRQPIRAPYHSNAGTTKIVHHNYSINTRDNCDCYAYGSRIRHRTSKTGYTQLEDGTSCQRTEKCTGTLCGFSTRQGNEIFQYGIISFSIKNKKEYIYS